MKKAVNVRKIAEQEKEESNADIVGLSTGVGPQIAVKTVSNVQETVKEYEKIKYIITVENTGSEVAENIKVNTKVPTGATVAVHSSYSSVEMAKGWTLKSDREITTTFEKINPGEVKKIEFFVQANKLPTIEEYYAGEEGFTKNDDGTYSINESYVDENGEIFYIYENAEPNSVKPIYPPKRPRAVLEVNAGQFKAKNIKAGAMVKNRLLDNMD